MTSNDGGAVMENKVMEIEAIMKELQEKRLAYNEMKRNDTFHIDVYEQTEVLLLLLNGLYAVYKQGRLMLDLMQK
jgi:hypothetical protein